MLRGFHAHIYFNADELALAQAFAAKAKDTFQCAVGHFHEAPIGPHPRGSCQLSLRVEEFGRFVPWACAERGSLTLFCHGLSGDDLVDHTQYVVWLGASETLNLAMFGVEA